MGRQFGVQIDEITKRQLNWVPRSVDAWGGGEQGMRLVGSVFGTETLWANLAIRDTAPHASLTADAADALNPTGMPYDQIYAPIKTAFVISSLNSAVTLQATWSLDGVTYYPWGSTVTVAAGTTDAPSTGVLALSTPQQYVPFVGVIATCSTAPTSGVLQGTVARLG